MIELDIYRLPNGMWTHSKTVAEFDDEIGARTDYRYCCEWEGEPNAPVGEDSFR